MTSLFNTILSKKVIASLGLLLIANFATAQEEVNDDTTNNQENVQLDPTESLSLEDPIKYEPYFDASTGNYILYPKVGNTIVGAPTSMTSEEYTAYMVREKQNEYYKEKSRFQDQMGRNRKNGDDTESSGFIPGIKVNSKLFETLFGGNEITLEPTGYASLSLGVLHQKIDNPQLPIRNRSNLAIDVQQRIQMGILASVGKDLTLGVNYDTQAGFAFENQLKLAWASDDEDQIVKRIEFGNVNFPITNSLIMGPQALFGLKGEFQFGKTKVDAIISQQKSEARNIVVENGGTVTNFGFNSAEYEDKQHYFMGQYFRTHYDKALEKYPIINSTLSITKIEVWRIDIGNSNLQNQRPVVAIRDLGETNDTNTLPDNNSNGVYTGVASLAGIRDDATNYGAINGKNLPDYTGASVSYKSGEHFVTHKRVRKLEANEFTYDAKLGYISLNQPLTDNQLLGVSFQYTDAKTGITYKVGEFSDENAQALIVKLLKPNSTVSTKSPMWDLMMKNIYSLGGQNITPEGFNLGIFFKDPSQGKINYLPDGTFRNKTLLQLLNFDRLDPNNNTTPDDKGDGIFDFVSGITIEPGQGKLIFTKTQPFGNYLKSLGVSDKYIFTELYSELKGSSAVTGHTLVDKYTIEGKFKGMVGDGIFLGALNVPRGSVQVMANGKVLEEGVDYVVDYQLGLVNMINKIYEETGVPIHVSLENQLAYNQTTKTYLGVNVEHVFNENFLIGGTVVNYKERGASNKGMYGDEPVNNTMLGLNMMYKQQAPFLTRLVNKIPGVRTDAESSIAFSAEGAMLLPGQNKSSNNEAYVDDFENASTKISISDPASWHIASKPVIYNAGRDPQFVGGELMNDLKTGYGRGLVSWYNIDSRLVGDSQRPAGIDKEALSKHMQRRVQYKEIFDNKDYNIGDNSYLNTFDVSYYPEDRGPYNYNPAELDPSFSDYEGMRWGGIMRALNTTNFTDANVEYVEFWMMDPYADEKGGSLGANPELILDLGNISEDILRDGYLQYENGLPVNPEDKVTESVWGKQPKQAPLLYAFDNDKGNREKQDVGLDGLNDEEEYKVFGVSWYNPISKILDPSADNYVSFRDGNWDSSAEKGSIVQRYKYFKNPDGNSNISGNESSTGMPSTEDINGDYNLDQDENFNQYRLKLSKADLDDVGNNFVADKKTVKVTLANGKRDEVNWYLVRIPVKNYEAGMGSDENLNNVRFMRLLLKGFNKTTTLRFASFDLVRNDWSAYEKNIASSISDDEGTSIEDASNVAISYVNIEENSTSNPPYVLPPGISQETFNSTGGTSRENEGSIKMEVKDLRGDAPRGVYKSMNMDMRQYKRLKMFVHAEDLLSPNSSSLDPNAKVFIRMGTDLTENYYEYETSLKYTARNASSTSDIWPTENNIDILTSDLVNAKLEKDKALGHSSTDRFRSTVIPDDNKAIYVKGRPSLGEVKFIMIGVRNNDTGFSKHLALWFDELRLAEIEQEAGYAAKANLNIDAGGFLMVDANGAYQSANFGAIDSKPVERSKDQMIDYNVNVAMNLEKALPEKARLKVPISASYGETFIDPKYNPLDTDVEFKDDPRKDELKREVKTYSSRKSIAVTNLRQERKAGKKPRFYDLENLSASFYYGNEYFRDIYTQYSTNQRLNTSLDYQYSTRGKYYQPFKNWSAVQDSSKYAKFLRPLKEFNINPIPTRLGFRTSVQRTYSEYLYRDVDALLSGAPGASYMPNYSSDFLFSWQYNIGFNPTKSLKVDFTSSTETSLRELDNNKNAIWNKLLTAGDPVGYDQKLQVTYKVPLEYFSYMNWADVQLGYMGQYNWSNNNYQYAGDYQNSRNSIGNTAQNAQTLNVMANLDFEKLYTNFEGYNKFLTKKEEHRRATDSLSTLYDEQFAKKGAKKGFKKFNYKNKYKSTDYMWFALSSIKKGNLQYTKNMGTLLPGFMGKPGFLGLGNKGPSFGFVFGSQYDIRQQAIQEGWISDDPLMTDPFLKTYSNMLNASLQLEPVNNLNIDLNFLRNHQKRKTQYGFNNNIDAFESETSMFTSSTVSIGGAFQSSDAIYKQMLENAKILSHKIASASGKPMVDSNGDGFIDGFGLANSDVLVPAFVSAFSGKSADGQKLGYKRGFPLPNWAVSYGGLKGIPTINYLFKDIRLLNSYVSTYTANGVQSNLNYFDNPNGMDLNGNYYTPYTYGTVVMSEGFHPLIGIDVTMRNNLQLSFAYNRDRTSMLSLTNYTLQEEYGNEFVFGTGYIFRDLMINIGGRNGRKTLKSDLNLKGAVAIRDNKTTIRKILDDDTQITGGQTLLSFQFSADYNFSQNLNLKLFYNQMMSKYKISTAYPISTINAGISATFTFGGTGEL